MLKRPRTFSGLCFPTLEERTSEKSGYVWVDEIVRHVIQTAADILIAQDREVLRKPLTDDIVRTLEQAIEAGVDARRSELESHVGLWQNTYSFKAGSDDSCQTLEDVIGEARKTLRQWNESDPYQEHVTMVITFSNLDAEASTREKKDA